MEWSRAVCYSGYREGQSPRTCTYPTYEQIKEDLKILNSLGFKYIRMYDPVIYAEMTCRVIREVGYNMQMMLGPDLISEVNNPNCPWMQTNYSEAELRKRALRNDANIEELIRIANENADIINIVSVGNENTPSWGANNVPVERLIEFAKKLKQGTRKPVTYNEGAVEWENLSELAENLDIVSIHSYPLWGGISVEDSLKENKRCYKKVKELYPDKKIIFSEVGWATSSVSFAKIKKEQANEANQKRYIDEFWKWTDSEKIIAYMFEAFDEPWKGGNTPEEPEKNWGMYFVDRTPKMVLQ